MVGVATSPTPNYRRNMNGIEEFIVTIFTTNPALALVALAGAYAGYRVVKMVVFGRKGYKVTLRKR